MIKQIIEIHEVSFLKEDEAVGLFFQTACPSAQQEAGSTGQKCGHRAAAHGLDPARCWAYSDSISDEPMLSAVGHPVAVNPDRDLRRMAQERD
ncbi:MAG: HAD family hydrolase, partial [Neisseria elongata]